MEQYHTIQRETDLKIKKHNISLDENYVTDQGG